MRLFRLKVAYPLYRSTRIQLNKFVMQIKLQTRDFSCKYLYLANRVLHWVYVKKY
jgi:hypothetical protein